MTNFDNTPANAHPVARDRERFRLWAPAASHVRVRVNGTEHEMLPTSTGWWEAPDVRPKHGDRYAFHLDDSDLWIPDPRSLHQPDGVHGDSEVVSIEELRNRDTAPWQGKDFRGGAIYELHIGTFTPGPARSGGTFDSAIDRLDHLAELGVDAVEVMPVAAFPGERGWGYDGVGLYAVQAAYGGPAGFMRFIEAAHARGMAVILDVVYNHLGPSGNYLALQGPYFTQRYTTPWGPAINLDDDGADQVRSFILDAARQWLVDFQLDGLRLDAVHELRDESDQHVLAELSDAVAQWERETQRPLTLIAESDRNDPLTVTATARGGFGMDMQWADDIHHAVHAWISGERDGYYVDFGSTTVLENTLTRMFEHAGTFSTFRDRTWGAPVDPDADSYDAHSFVAFLHNHDQIGNRAIGDRTHHSVLPGQQAAGIALVLLGAATPMLFQGEEWASSSPFTFFTDHDDELGPMITAGRKAEFAAMGWSKPVPDPQAVSTFTAAILNWDEAQAEPHRDMLQWYRELIRLRREIPDFRDSDLHQVSLQAISEDTVVLARGAHRVIAHRGESPVTVPLPGTWRELARFDDQRTEGDQRAHAAHDGEITLTDEVALNGQGAVVLAPQTT